LGLTTALDVTAAATARIILTCMSLTTTNSSHSESGDVRARCPRSAIAVAISISITACFGPATVASATDGIELASVHAAVGDLRTGKVLYTKRDDLAVPIASITKLMTAMVTLDAGQPLDEWIPIVRRKNTHGKNGYSRLRPGSEATRGELLRLTLMASENLAAYVLASHYPGGVDAFVAAMNTKAEALGMTQTRFDDPSGLSLGNRSCAGDLLKMVGAAYKYEAIRDYSTTFRHMAKFRLPDYELGYGNTNPLTASSRWDVALSKTGYLNEAGRCLVMVAEIDGEPVAMVFLNSFGTRTPLGDAGRVRRWIQTGSSGGVAKAALDYEQRVVTSKEQPQLP
jgi:D-alanyl-D-alanine endopeptidase (penicillin-binding protein 7)